MTRQIIVLLFSIATISLTNCATHSTVPKNKWYNYEIPPSQITYNGVDFMNEVKSASSKFYVYSDRKVSADAQFYYQTLMQDFGWYLKDDDTWETIGYSIKRVKFGHIYINPSRGVAVYIYPKGTYGAFKVINK